MDTYRTTSTDSVRSTMKGNTNINDSASGESISLLQLGEEIRIPFRREREYIFYKKFENLLQINLTNLDRALLKPNYAKLSTLKSHNYHTWAQAHRRFLRGRGMWGIKSGTIPVPTSPKEVQSHVAQLDVGLPTTLSLSEGPVTATGTRVVRAYNLL